RQPEGVVVHAVVAGWPQGVAAPIAGFRQLLDGPERALELRRRQVRMGGEIAGDGSSRQMIQDSRADLLELDLAGGRNTHYEPDCQSNSDEQCELLQELRIHAGPPSK